MAIRVQRHTNVSKPATSLDGLDVSPLKWHVCGCGLNLFVHEGMNDISNVKVHLKTSGENVNIILLTLTMLVIFIHQTPTHFFLSNLLTGFHTLESLSIYKLKKNSVDLDQLASITLLPIFYLTGFHIFASSSICNLSRKKCGS